MISTSKPNVNSRSATDQSSGLQKNFFPLWDQVKAEHVKPGILHIIGELNDELTELEKNVKPTWDGLIEPLERISDRISRAWGTVSHLKAVKDTQACSRPCSHARPPLSERSRYHALAPGEVPA